MFTHTTHGDLEKALGILVHLSLSYSFGLGFPPKLKLSFFWLSLYAGVRGQFEGGDSLLLPGGFQELNPGH